MAVALNDEDLIDYLYFGTPFESFKQRLIESYGPIDANREYLWKLGTAAKKSIRFTLSTYTQAEDPKHRLKPGQAIHRLMRTLLSDFYRPFSRLELFEQIFPGEHYTPKVSEVRVHQLLFRTREWCTTNKIPLLIEGNKNEYRLAAGPGVEIVCEPSQSAENAETFRFQTLHSQFPNGFKTQEAAIALGISRRTAASLILTAVGEGTLVKRGSGRATYYAFNSSEPAKKKAG